MHFLLLTMLPHLAVGKAENNLYSLAHCSPNNNPQKLEILHVYLFGGYGNPCATQNASANKKVHRVRFQRLWTDYGLHRFTDNSDWTLFSHQQRHWLVLQARTLWWAQQVSLDSWQRSIKNVWQVTRWNWQRSNRKVWQITQELWRHNIMNVWQVTRGNWLRSINSA